MKNLIINNEVISIESMKADLAHAVQEGFKGFNKLTPNVIMEMLHMLNHSSMVIDKEVPVDVENPNWNGGNRIYEWKIISIKNKKNCGKLFLMLKKLSWQKKLTKKLCLNAGNNIIIPVIQKIIYNIKL